jgi:hypothetical protein
MSSSQSSHPHDPADVIGQLIRILQDILAVLAETHPGGILTTRMLDLTCRQLDCFRRRQLSAEAATPALVALTVLATAQSNTRPPRAARASQRNAESSSPISLGIIANESHTAAPCIRGPCGDRSRRKARATTAFSHAQIVTLSKRNVRSG